MTKGYRASAPPRSLEEAYVQWSQIDPANLERADYWLHTSLLPRLLELCADAVQRRHPDALTLWLNPAPDLAGLYRRLGAPAAERVLQALQIAADALRAPQPPDDPADADLYGYFRTGRWRKPTRSVRLTVALADPEDPELALALTLTLERIPDADTPYPYPAAHWLLGWDAAFKYALDAARLGGVRWSLHPLPISASIQGDSLGGAFALGARLLETCPGDHQRFAVLARFDPDTQRLLPVEQFQEKYAAVHAHKGVRVILISPAQLGETPPRAQTLLTHDYSPFIPFRYRRLETLHTLQPEQRAQWLRHAQRLPADDPASQLARARALYTMDALTPDALLRQLEPLALRAPDPQIRLETLEHIARHDPDWVLSIPELRQLIVNASLIRSQRAYGLRVLARLSQTRLIETAPLIEPYRNDPIIQGSRDQVDLLIQMLLRRDEAFYFTERERVNDVYITDRTEAECLVLVFEGLLLHFARTRPTLQTRWEFLLQDLRTPYAARWAVHRGALLRALIALAPPAQYPALRQRLQQRLQQSPPMHERLTLQQALQHLGKP